MSARTCPAERLTVTFVKHTLLFAVRKDIWHALSLTFPLILIKAEPLFLLLFFLPIVHRYYGLLRLLIPLLEELRMCAYILDYLPVVAW